MWMCARVWVSLLTSCLKFDDNHRNKPQMSLVMCPNIMCIRSSFRPLNCVSFFKNLFQIVMQNIFSIFDGSIRNKNFREDQTFPQLTLFKVYHFILYLVVCFLTRVYFRRLIVQSKFKSFFLVFLEVFNCITSFFIPC